MNGYRSNVWAMDMDLNCYVWVLHMKQENRRRLTMRISHRNFGTSSARSALIPTIPAFERPPRSSNNGCCRTNSSYHGFRSVVFHTGYRRIERGLQVVLGWKIQKWGWATGVGSWQRKASFSSRSCIHDPCQYWAPG